MKVLNNDSIGDLCLFNAHASAKSRAQAGKKKQTEDLRTTFY